MIELLDVQCGFLGVAPGRRAPDATGEDLAAEMARLKISRAVARVVPEAMEHDIVRGNAKLYAACRANPALIPCPVVVASNGANLRSEEEQVDDAVLAGAGAVWIRPGQDGWPVTAWASDELFRALEARRMPVICLERLVNLDLVARTAGRYPRLPVIVAETGYRSQQVLMGLLRRYPNVFLSTGNNYIVHCGIEQIVGKLGAGRLLFGTGFPASEAMGAVTQLVYADLADAQKQQIGTGNFELLRGAIVR